MHNPPLDPSSALALRSQYRQWESRAARLRLLVDTGQELTQLPPAAMRQKVLQRACGFVAMDHGVLMEWSATQTPQPSARHGSPERLEPLMGLQGLDQPGSEWLSQAPAALPSVLRVPLLAADGKPFGALLLGNSVAIAAPDAEDLESLQLLATLLAAHLENNRLLAALSERERIMSELVHRLFTAQEDERKRVAYDLHDGLAQTLAGLHQRLQGFAGRCPALPAQLSVELQTILGLAQRCVGEGRQVIKGLRPSVLDDFGLLQAIDKEADRLREAGCPVRWSARLSTRLPDNVEIALFRIAQECINNILKHAGPCRVSFGLALHEGQACLLVRDDGVGFDMRKQAASERGHSLGLAAMCERANLLGGRLVCVSEPGKGTEIRATVPMSEGQDKS
ncbi:sensor histidine kinase [Pseudomonas sp. nanlin1]|uniref:sensor histidine kinase n=1 Tax=Pseudomonas sp. nanlin1 TaxID=3040605 RepID=UPI00388FB6B4